MNLKKKKERQDIIQHILKWLFPWASIFSFLQFLQLIIPKCYFLQFELAIVMFSLLGAWFWNKYVLDKILEKYLYRYVSKDSKLILNIYYGDIFDEDFNKFIKVIPMDRNLDCDQADIRIKSVYTNTNNIELNTYTDYFSMIYELCQFIDDNAHGKAVVCSVIGGNIQFKEGSLNSMQRLQLLKLAFESYSFQHEVDIHIVIKKDEERIDKYDLTIL